MFASCQILIRAATLMFATGLFAGLWVNDQPVVESRQTLLQELKTAPVPVIVSEEEWTAWVAANASPSEQRIPAEKSNGIAAEFATEFVAAKTAGNSGTVNDADGIDEWQPIPAPAVVSERRIGHQTAGSASVPPTPLAQRRSVDAEHLSLPPQLFQRHLDLLPAEIASGDYRIIDPYGGVGWLFVRNTDKRQEEHASEEANDGIWTTSIDGVSVRFIRAAPQPDRII